MRGARWWELQGWLYESLFVLLPHDELVRAAAMTIADASGTVVDAGCGTARLSMYAGIDAMSFDASSTMLRRAKRRTGMVAQVDLCRGWPIADDTCSVVVSLNVFYALADSEAMLREAHRVLESGGQLLLATPTTSKLTPLIADHLRRASLRQLALTIIELPRLIGWAVNLAIRGIFDHVDFAFYEEKDVIEQVTKAGFDVTDVRRSYADIDVLVTAKKANRAP